MALHAGKLLQCPSVSEVFDLLLAHLTLEACSAKDLVLDEEDYILYIIVTGAAIICICTSSAGENAVGGEKKRMRIRVENDSASITAETVYMPPIAC